MRSVVVGWLIYLGLSCALFVSAQRGYPLPDNLQPISTDNVSQIQKLASIGSALPRQLLWSPNGEILTVSTSSEIYLYDASNFDGPPRIISKSGNLHFNQMGELIINNERWDANTGAFIGLVESNIFDGISVQVSHLEQEEIAKLSKVNDTSIELVLKDNYDFERLLLSPDQDHVALVLIRYQFGSVNLVTQLWSLESETHIVDIPHIGDDLRIIAFHAGGRLLVTGSTNNAVYGYAEDVQIWDVFSGTRLYDYGFLFPVRFIPDGELFAHWSNSGHIIVWEDREIGRLDLTRSGEIGETFYTFSPDSQFIANISDDEVWVWDISTISFEDEPILTLSAENRVSHIWFTPDSDKLITKATDMIEVWDARTGERLYKIESAPPIFQLRFSPDSRYFGGTSTFWNVQNGEVILRLDGEAILDDDWSHAAYWDGGNVKVRDIITGQEILLNIIPNYIGNIANFSPQTGHIIFVGQEMSLFDLPRGQKIFSRPSNSQTSRFNFVMNGQRFIEESRFGGEIKIRDIDNPQSPIAQFEIPGGSYDWVLSSDGKYLSQFYGYCGDGGAFAGHNIWDIEAEEIIFTGGYDDCRPFSQTISSDGKILILGTREIARIIDFVALTQEAGSSNMEELSSLVTMGVTDSVGMRSDIEVLTLSPNNQYLVLHRQFRPEVSERPITEHRISVYDLSSSPDQNRFLRPIYEIPDAQFGIFSPDSRWILTDIGLWNLQTFTQHVSIQSSMSAFSPDGTLLVTTTDEHISLWDFSAVIEGHLSPLKRLNIEGVEEIAFSPDGSILYINQAGEIELWGVTED